LVKFLGWIARAECKDAAYVSWSLCLSVMSCAITVEPIEMPFMVSTRVGPSNRVLVGGLDPHMKGNFGVHREYPGCANVICQVAAPMRLVAASAAAC